MRISDRLRFLIVRVVFREVDSRVFESSVRVSCWHVVSSAEEFDIACCVPCCCLKGF